LGGPSCGFPSVSKHLQRRAEVFQAISKVVVEAQQNGIIASPPPIVGRIHQEMGLGMTKLQNAMTPGKNACENMAKMG